MQPTSLENGHDTIKRSILKKTGEKTTFSFQNKKEIVLKKFSRVEAIFC